MAKDDEPDLLGPARPFLATAVLLGGRAAQAGNPLGCYELLACAARLARKVKGLAEVADFRIERALESAEGGSEVTEQARGLREAIEGMLDDGDEPPAIPDEPLAAAQTYIGMAISVGAPAYNTGDHQGCYDVYACTARMILATVNGADEAKRLLKEALDTCAEMDDPNEQAWAMRHSFDAIGELGVPPVLAPREVQMYLSLAVRIGAPAYNAGDHRGCYEVYACAARFLVNAGAVPDEVKHPLKAALAEASTLQNVSRQAWVMRHAFDALLPKTAEGYPT